MSITSEQIAKLSPGKQALLDLRLRKGRRMKTYPLSFAQQRLWFIHRMDPGSAAYNSANAIRMIGEIDKNALERSLSEIIRRHEVLRTIFPERDGEPVQQVFPSEAVRIPLIDFRGLDNPEESSRDVFESEYARPFDLSKGPLLRLLLFRLSDQDHVLILVVHHIASDGWSVGIFTRELAALYESFRQGKSSPLPELKVQYGDFATWQRNRLQGERLETELNYWRRSLEGVSALELPIDHPRTAVPTHRGAVSPFGARPEVLAKLKALSQQEGATVFMTLLAAFAVVLGRYCDQSDITIGTDTANRNRLETEGLIGFFVNQLVLRIKLNGNPTFRELLRQVRDTTLGAQAHQDLPFEKLVAELAPERDLSRSPLFQVKLVLQNMQQSSLQLPALQLSSWSNPGRESRFDLALVVNESNLQGGAEYAADLFEAATIEGLLGSLSNLLDSIAANPDRKLSELDMLSPAERHQLLKEWSATRSADDSITGVLDTINAQVRRTPDAIAVSFDGQHLTYAQLNERANQVAHYLRRIGVQEEVTVGLYFNRGLDLMIAMLSVLKAGGAYLPLDPSYPEERLSYIIDHAGVPILLTQEILRERLPVVWALVISLDSDWEQIALESIANPEVSVSPETLAYVIYTSGSTGQPKGVGVTHQGFANLSAAQRDIIDLQPGTPILQFSAITFDAAGWEWIMALLTGGRLVMGSRRRDDARQRDDRDDEARGGRGGDFAAVSARGAAGR